MSNDQMLEKHVRASVVTRLWQLASEDSNLNEEDRDTLRETLDHSFPQMISHYLFNEQGAVRHERYDFGTFRELIQKYQDDLFGYVINTFSSQGWPQEDERVVDPGNLKRIVLDTPQILEKTVSVFIVVCSGLGQRFANLRILRKSLVH